MAYERISKFPVSKINIDPTLQPKHDSEWDRLFEAALQGTLPVYFAGVPLVLCIPFDLDYRPDLHPIGAKAIQATIEAAKANDFQNLIVYPRGKWFIVSDDYIPLFAALQGRPDFLPCFVLGKPDNDMLVGVQGPIAVGDLRKAFGFA